MTTQRHQSIALRPGMAGFESRRLGLGAVAQLLGVPRLTVWWWVKTNKLPLMNTDAEAYWWWSPTQVYRWALEHPQLKLSGRVPLRYWPSAASAAQYLGTADLSRAVATRWRTPAGVVSVLWPLADGHQRSLKSWAAEVSPHGDGAVILVTNMFFRGPDIDGFLPGKPDDGDYSTIWAQLARVLGIAVPYWPAALRQPELIHAWQPGAAPVTAFARSSIDSGPLLQLAATYPPDDNRALVLINLAQKINHDAYRAADFAVQRLTESEHLEPDHLTMAAMPLEVPSADSDDINPVARRAAWRDVQARTDRLASAVMQLYAFVDGGTDLAASAAYQIDSSESSWAQEWAARLLPCARTAAHNMLHDHPETDALADPETDAAVVRKENGTLIAAIPQRLPAQAPLKEMIFDGPVWIRTADGIIWPAPRDSYYGLSWGYDGSGPGALALLIDQLLDDINSPGAADINGAPIGLEKLTSTALPAGTVLSRDDLQAAREDRFFPVFTTDDEEEDDW
ncbi:helix-turn-helix transcriptional regulator [Actinoplanes subglobosus]|uniref:Helix-turn-helix transcriptional regulator n=1 Tax=Actinoplanes subglobosus TaxID=1547892 RepID=A0ABV8IMF7_9ACTN